MMSRFSNGFGLLLLLLLQLRSSSAHMSMIYPPPLRDPKDPNVSEEFKDYSYTSPLLSDGSNFPCKGYHNGPFMQAKQQYMLGQTYNITLSGGTNHFGGSCQISLSNTEGTRFTVLKSIIGGCPHQAYPPVSYNFTIPPWIPPGDALLAWTWFNYEGNREMYMNCALITIIPSPGDHVRARMRHRNRSFDGQPASLYVSNIPTVNNCTTIGPQGEIVVPVFPHPGLEVQYGQLGASVNSKALVNPNDAATPGICELSSVPIAFRDNGKIFDEEGTSTTTSSTITTTSTSTSTSTTSTTSTPHQGYSQIPSPAPISLTKCNVAGTITCADDGGSFLMCANGEWVFMGRVAQGTVCQDGQMKAG